MNGGNALKNFKYCAKLPQDAPNGSLWFCGNSIAKGSLCLIDVLFQLLIRTKLSYNLIKIGNLPIILSLHLFTIYDLGTFCWILKVKNYQVKLCHRERPPCEVTDFFVRGGGVRIRILFILLCEFNNFYSLLRPPFRSVHGSWWK